MSLVGFKARNHPQQQADDTVDDRRAPRALWVQLHAAHQFTIDVAASHENALLPRYWTRADNGLAQSWRGERVWCNPPFSAIEPWVQKAWTAMLFEGADLVVMLLPANRTEQAWWQRKIEPFRDGNAVGAELGATLTTHFLAGRLRFEWPAARVVPAKGDRPPFGCVLAIWRRE